jgi:hypothetical protein
MKEEPWKRFLNWGAVIMFFSMPLLVMAIQLLALAFPNVLAQELPQSEFKYLYEFQRALAILVFGLAGLRTWEHVKNGNGKPKAADDPRPQNTKNQ